MTDEQIIEALATKVMGWRQVKFPAMVTESADDGIVRFIVNSAGEIETRRRRDGAWGNWEYFRPLTNPADSKMVRDKLAERFGHYELAWWRNPSNSGGSYNFTVVDHSQDDYKEFDGGAPTEEMAVAWCALRTVGVEPYSPLRRNDDAGGVEA